MKITALKSGKFAHPEPSKGILVLREGCEYDVDGKMAASLIDCGWGDPVAEKSADEKPLNKMNKKALIKFAEENEIDLDPNLTNGKMIKAIEAVING